MTMSKQQGIRPLTASEIDDVAGGEMAAVFQYGNFYMSISADAATVQVCWSNLDTREGWCRTTF
jgi:hypothetical protein